MEGGGEGGRERKGGHRKCNYALMKRLDSFMKLRKLRASPRGRMANTRKETRDTNDSLRMLVHARLSR